MNAKKMIVPALLAGLALGLVSAPFLAGQAQQPQDKKDAKQAQPKIFIPKEVKDVLLQNLPTRQARQDIPFTIFRTSFLPGRDNAVFYYLFLKIKNADLGFAPAGDKVKADFPVFLQVYKVENGQPTQILREIYCPTVIEQDAASFDPEKEETYTLWLGLFPGDYLAGVAVTSRDLKKIGIQFQEIAVPDARSFTKELDTTPLLFLREYKEVPAAELNSAMHKDYFRFAVLQLTPNCASQIGVGEALEAFFYIFGAQPNEQGLYSIECLFEVNKGKDPAIKFAPQPYPNPFIDQPLPMKQTLITKKTDEKGVVTESQAVQDLPPGSYTFTVKITDKVSGRTCTKSADFTVLPPAGK